MKREEHLQWAKDRAIAHKQIDTSMMAWMSFMSDMSKHEELKGHSALSLGTKMILNNMLETDSEFERFINGFN